VQGWKADIETAMDELRHITDLQQVTLVGLRLGATLAAAVAADRQSDVDELVLWDPVVSGPEYLAELGVVRGPQEVRSTPPVPRPAEAGGGHEVAGAGIAVQRLPGAGQVVVTEDDAADAYTLPGWPCRIVITSGMLRALSGPERDVLLAHERSHAAASHYLFTSAARLAAAANPLLRPVAAQVCYTVERWADERAATATGDRPLTARAIARAALATSAAPADRDAPMTALGLVTPEEEAKEGDHQRRRPGLRGAGPVPRRVAALLGPPPRTRLLLLGAAVALVAVSGLSALDAARSLHALVELAQAAG